MFNLDGGKLSYPLFNYTIYMSSKFITLVVLWRSVGLLILLLWFQGAPTRGGCSVGAWGYSCTPKIFVKKLSMYIYKILYI